MKNTNYRIKFSSFGKKRFVDEQERNSIRKYKKLHGLQHAGTVEALNSLGATLDRAGIDWWLSYGALLGLIRDGRFIRDDLDLDIMVGEDTNPDHVKETLTAANGTLVTRISYGGEVTNENYWFKGVYIDVYFAKRLGFHRVDFSRFAGCAFLLEHEYQASKHLCVQGMTFKTPSHPSSYLEKLYGPNWRTPDPNWCWYRQQDPVEIWGNPLNLAICYCRRELMSG